MKKLFTMLIMGFMLFASAKAQTATLMPLALGDTVITSSSLDTVFKAIPVTAGYSAFGIQVNATKISGTVSAKAYLYGSLDGTNYNLTDSSSAFADQTTNVAWFTKTSVPYTSYKVQVRPSTSTGTTQSVKVRVYYVLRKYDR